MIIDWYEIGLWIFVCIIHEIGHLVHFWIIMRRLPKIKFTILGIFPQITDQLTVGQKMTNIFIAYWSGYLTIVALDWANLLHTKLLYGAYLLGTSWDLIIFIVLFYISVKKGLDFPLTELEK